MMKFSIDPLTTNELVLQFSDQFDRLNAADPIVAQLRTLYAGDKTLDFYEGLLSGYSNAFAMLQHSGPNGTAEQQLGRTVAFVAAQLRGLRPPSLRLERDGPRVVVAGALSFSLPPAEFAFYALLARRALTDPRSAFVCCDTAGLVDQYLDEYRRVAADGEYQHVEKSLRNPSASQRRRQEWFRERKARVNATIKSQCGPVLADVYGIATEGSRPNQRSGLKLDPDCIDVRDWAS